MTCSPPLYATFATHDETDAQLPATAVVAAAAEDDVVVVVTVEGVETESVVVLADGVETVTGAEVVPPLPFWRIAFLMPWSKRPLAGSNRQYLTSSL